MEASHEADAVDGEVFGPPLPSMNRKQKREMFKRVADRATRKRVFGVWRTRQDWKREGH